MIFFIRLFAISHLFCSGISFFRNLHLRRSDSKYSAKSLLCSPSSSVSNINENPETLTKEQSKEDTIIENLKVEGIENTVENKDSVHLKLYEMVVNKGNETKPDIKTNTIHIHEYISLSENTSLVATTCEKWKLQHFYKHIYGSNATFDKDVEYKERFIEIDDKYEYEKYFQLFNEGKFMASTKKFSHDWRSPESKKPALKVKDFIFGNIRRIKSISEDDKTVPLVLNFLKNQTIEGSSWDYFRKDDSLSTEITLQKLKLLLTWLRREFPYYYNECGFCRNRDENCYLGTVHSTPEELGWDSSRTELYYCGKCHEVTRFPRYNVMEKVIQTRKGRCGEYSVLLLQMLRALDYNARWVVDREDHVWAEVELGGFWYHCDPCEAAVNEPLLYQSWGKNQTFIFAFSFDKVEDVTLTYTDNHVAVRNRRLEENVTDQYLNSLLEEMKQNV